MKREIKKILKDVKCGNISISKGHALIQKVFDIVPNFSEEEAQLAIDSIERAIAVTDWDNFKKEEYEDPEAQRSWMYWLISKLKKGK